MAIFIPLLAESEKSSSLLAICQNFRDGATLVDAIEIDPHQFTSAPGSPFCYWVTDDLLATFSTMRQVESTRFSVRVGIQTSDDFRFLRLHWEPKVEAKGTKWHPYSKGGAYSPFYSNLDLVALWEGDGREMKAWTESLYGGGQHWSRNLRSVDFSFRPAITWPQRSQIGLSARIMPKGCLFGIKGPAVFDESDNSTELLALLALMQSKAFRRLVALQMAFGSFDVGVIQRTPIPDLEEKTKHILSDAALRSWKILSRRGSNTETNSCYLLPSALIETFSRKSENDLNQELLETKDLIDDTANKAYGILSEPESNYLLSAVDDFSDRMEVGESDDSDVDECIADSKSELLSWTVGISFGRFDLRVATGEREVTAEPEPFDPLPALSPGMLPIGAAPFHAHDGILVDDPGHAHDLARLVDEVLVRVNQPVPDDLRRWLQREFFAFHLQRYSKSRRKAPIYWPLATASGSYTLWIYYPSLSSQTLYSAINDFLDGPNGKLTQVAGDVAALRSKGAARTRDEEKRLETLEAFELELIELRDTLLKIAPTFKPNHDDGVQITAAPLWALFRHKPWQKILKDTWAKLGKGDYDWAHLALNYWPDRVREKCKADKSLAIAHGLEALYIDPPPKAAATRGRKAKEA